MTRVPVYSTEGDKKVGYVVRQQPICGEDFCDGCGDCLYCYRDSECAKGQHRWLYYEDNLPEGAVLVKGCKCGT